MVWINCFSYTQYECMVRTWWPGTEANFITKKEALEFNCIMCLRTGLNERFRVIIYKRDTCVCLKQCRFRASCNFFNIELFWDISIFIISLCRDECRELPLSPDHWHHDWEPESDQWERELREAQSGGPGGKWTSSKNWCQRRPAEGCLEQIKYKSRLKVVPESIWTLHVGFKCTWASNCSCITFAKIIKMLTKFDNQKVSKYFLSSWLLSYNLKCLLWKVFLLFF